MQVGKENGKTPEYNLKVKWNNETHPIINIAVVDYTVNDGQNLIIIKETSECQQYYWKNATLTDVNDKMAIKKLL